MTKKRLSEFDELIDNAIEICKAFDHVSPYLLHRMLSINLERAAKIFYQLKDLRIIAKEKYLRSSTEYSTHLGVVDKKKIRELSLN